MKKRSVSAFLALLMLVVCFLPACNKETAPETTEEKVVKKDPVKDPAEDGALNILMVGNSFCYYYVEELYELLKESQPEGINEINIFNLYYSGCSLTQHLNWWVSGEANYDLYKTSALGRNKMGEENWTLEEALGMAKWDYISLQGSTKGASYIDDDPAELCKNMAPLAAPLLERFHEVAPGAQLLWHRTWYYEIGRVATSGYVYTEEDGPKYNAGMQTVCDYMCGEFCEDKPYDLVMVNSGAAWTKARELNETAGVLPYGGLCARLGKNSFGDLREHSGDGYHDGDIGGAQLLNAYVWYMTITGDHDVSDSTYEPTYTRDGVTYTLTKEHIALLKEAAMSVFQ
ncbi:MAG: DUF4886 domain-containing protein [Oscillospiraceae bacterium]|nr:DUF4886 domain-containing protein [Oscillospiraceae bacterium]